MKFKNYGLPVNDLVQEGHIGLMQAMAKFEPNRDIRFSHMLLGGLGQLFKIMF